LKNIESPDIESAYSVFTDLYCTNNFTLGGKTDFIVALCISDMM
jgi:hypothetical protein